MSFPLPATGIVFLPGAAGTVQEIFQAACTSYYASAEQAVPMVFVGRDHWTRALPAWPLVSALARGLPFETRAHLVDDTSQVSSLLSEERPEERPSAHGSSLR